MSNWQPKPDDEDAPRPEPPVLSYRLPPSVDQATVAKYDEELEAQLAIGALRCRGIDARLARLGQMEVRVPTAQAPQAAALLCDLRQRAERARAARRCPACGIEGVESASLTRRIAGVLLILLGLAALWIRPAFGVVLIAIGIGAAIFAASDEVLRCPKCRRTLPRLDPSHENPTA